MLEIGPGPSNETSDFLSGIGSLSGLDISPQASGNRALLDSHIFDGLDFPFESGSFDGCASNYVVEHLENPLKHFAEVERILRPGGTYVFRCPNIFNYVPAISRLTPYRVHLFVANRARALPKGARDPYPTYYRCNSRSAIRRVSRETGLDVKTLNMIEAEPSYGKGSRFLFYPMLAWERLVNSTTYLEEFRSNILAVVRKPEQDPQPKQEFRDS